jgi:hypothetical protein
VTKSRSGYFKVGRKTERGRFAKKLAALNVRMSQMRLAGGKAMMKYFVIWMVVIALVSIAIGLINWVVKWGSIAKHMPKTHH